MNKQNDAPAWAVIQADAFLDHMDATIASLKDAFDADDYEHVRIKVAVALAASPLGDVMAAAEHLVETHYADDSTGPTMVIDTSAYNNLRAAFSRASGGTK